MTDLPKPRPLVHAGTAIGHYEIISFIGAGGMGEVYEARDTRLGRSVALKILPAIHGQNRDRVRRFELEVRTTTRLSHPNIVSIFDAGEFETRPYLVTELLEGETLRSYIANHRPLPLRKVTDLALQIVRGLAAAHDKGIIHRDLKPANIFVLSDGHVKILDFGLAKLIDGEAAAHSRDDDTASVLSMPGAVMGSVGYMSPEQIETIALDGRSDIFSFGAILYEMLTAERAFTGSSTGAVISSILKNDPRPIAELRPDLPAALVAIVNRCLEKLPEQRFQSAHDLAFNLGELETRSATSLSGAAITAVRGIAKRLQHRSTTTLSVAVALAVLVFAIVANLKSSSAPPSPAAVAQPRLTRLTSSGRVGITVAISPDGKYVAFEDASVPDGKDRLMLLHVPTGSSTELARATVPPAIVPSSFGAARFSPDGNYIYVVRETEGSTALVRIPLLGGNPEVIATGADWRSLSISRTGAEVAFVRTDDKAGTSSVIVTSSDGKLARIVAARRDPDAFFTCNWSKDPQHLFCTARIANEDALVDVDTATGVQRRVPKLGGLLEEYLPADAAFLGTTPYAAGSQIVKIDAKTGEQTRITNDLSLYYPLDVTPDESTVAAVRLDSSINLWVVSVADPPQQKQITAGSNTMDGNFGVAVAAGNRIVWSSNRTGRSFDLWISEFDGSNPRRLTFDDSSDERWPMTSTKTGLIAYTRTTKTNNEAHSDIWCVSPDGSDPRQLTTIGDALPPRFAADGQSLIFCRKIEENALAYEVPITGGEVRLLDEHPTGIQVAPSPDGKWLLAQSFESPGKLELRPYKRPGPSRLISMPRRLRRWSPDGSSIAYLGKGGLWVFHLDGRPPTQLTNLPDGQTVTPGFDWTPDGKHIVFARRDDRREVVLIRGLK